jgi:RND superfamily putative drug exporter
MLAWLARFLIRRKVPVLAAALAALVLAGVFGAGAVSKLKTGGFQDPAAESTRAAEALRDPFHTGEPNLVLLVTARTGTVDDAAVAAAGMQVTRRLAAERDVSEVRSYWAGRAAPLRSGDGRQALLLARLTTGEEQLAQRAGQLATTFESGAGPVSVQVGGLGRFYAEVQDQVERDLSRAEGIAIPITLVLLVVVFSSAVAGALPLAVGGLAIVGTLLVLRVLAGLTDVSVYSLNLTTALGLGLGIDYSLFIVSRYREELRAGREPDDALVATMRTAGRTVLFSSATVAAALLALLVFPLYFLRSFGYAGIAVVALAAVGALVVLPALLALLGRRVDALRLPLPRRRRATRTPASARAAAAAQAATPTPAPATATPEASGGVWHRIAMIVMARPLPIGLAVVALLLLLGAPFLGVRFGLPDDRVLQRSAVSRQVADAIRDNFGARDADTLTVVATGTGAPAGRTGDIDRYAAALSTQHGVARVDALTGTYVDGRRVAGTGGSGGLKSEARAGASGREARPSVGPPVDAVSRFTAADGTWLAVVPSVEAYSAAGEDLVARVRALPAPFPVQVGGTSAELVDTKAALLGHLPQGMAIIAAVTFVLLFLMTGSVVIPLKALVLNLLSLSAVYGAMVFVFQDGHLADLLGFTATRTIDTTMPVLLFCIAFGLSMDYEVFLLSRIKEEHDRGADTVTAVARGLERSGRIVTTLAALLAIVFVAFATSQVTFLKLFGLGTALAVVVDATLIRALLVPAFMRLAGRANWWAPRPLRALHERVGLREDVPSMPIPEVTRT